MPRVLVVAAGVLLAMPGLSAQDVDLKWGDLGSVSTIGREGTFPEGGNALTLSTTVCNEGTAPAPYQAVPFEAHPGTVLNMYRIAPGDDGIERIEQLGGSWVFHGYVPLGQSFCGTCTGVSTTELKPGCSNTHGSANMASQLFLGPRDEWNAFTGAWTCLGSYFDGTPVDCVQHETGAGLGPLDHRLAVADADLGQAGAEYLLEAMVVEVGEGDHFDNVASQRVTMVWTGASWNFSTPGAGNALVDGPTVLRWGDQQSMAGLAPHDGEVALSVAVTDLGGGQWRYEYALFNLSLDSLVDALSVATGGVALDVRFRDVDDLPATDWEASVVGGELTFALSAGVGVEAGPLGGPLEFGVLYGFGFTSDRPPTSGSVRLGLHLPGAGGDELIVSTTVPESGPSSWVSDGSRVSGTTTGGPRLSGVAPTPGAPGSIIVNTAPPQAAVTLVQRVPGPRPRLVPLFEGLTTDASGRLVVPLPSLPAGSPAAVTLQAFVVDESGNPVWSNLFELEQH